MPAPTRKPRPLSAEQLLFSQGFGTRRACRALVLAGELRIGGVVVDDPQAPVGEEVDGLTFEVSGKAWPYHAQAVVMLHKPAGYECGSTKFRVGYRA
jgi:16S rRNA pseudouridine516 synthase